MPRKIHTDFAACKFRGFSPQNNGSELIVFRHKKVRGIWTYGSYVYNQISGAHFIETHADKFPVIPETVGMQDPCSKLWTGDTCFRKGIRGVIRFGHHSDPTTESREEVHYYLEWLGDYPETCTWRTDLLYWAKQPLDQIVWAGTLWDPIAEYRHFLD